MLHCVRLSVATTRGLPGLVWWLALLGAWVMPGRGADSVLVFNEVQYHPANETTEMEWVELRSLQGVDVNIGGWRIEGGIDYQFPEDTVMPGGGYLVIARTPGQIPGALGPFTGQLDNGGETLRLVNRNGRVMDELSYEDQNDWPLAADGSGATLARRAATAASGPAQWAASTSIGGTPGSQNFPVADATATTVGVWSIDRWSSDATSLVSTTKTYTHKVDLGHSAAATVINGVTFDNSGTARSGTNWTLTGADRSITNNTSTNNSLPVGSGSRQLLSEFFYGTTGTSTEVLEITGLTPGQYYVLTQYCAGFGDREVRKLQVTPDNTGLAVNIDAGAAGLGAGILIKYQYRAPATGKLAITFVPPGSATWHQYGFTNEVASALPLETNFTGAVAVEGSSSQFTSREASHTVDESGYSNGNHGVTGNSTMWQTNGNAASPLDPLPAEITWSFASTARLTGLRIWNFNELTTPAAPVDNTNRGVKDVEIFVSSDLSGETFTSVGTFTVPQAFGCSAELGSRIGFAAVQNNVRRVRLRASTNWGDAQDFAGLAEVKFLTPPVVAQDAALAFNEISGASDPGFFVEVRNSRATAMDLAGWKIVSSAGQQAVLAAQTLPAGGLLAISAATLGFTPADGVRLYLVAPDGVTVGDAREVTNRPRGLTADGRWGHPTTSTPGAANIVEVSSAIVINEIFYHGLDASPEQWVELYNRSGAPVDVSLWKLTDGISYQFPAGTPPIPAHGFAVVAWNPVGFAALHAGVAAFGPFSGSLSGKGETITLRDANDNIANQVTYADGGRWSQWADGGGSSLSLRDPNADNTKPEAWGASDESGNSAWTQIDYQGLASNPFASDNITWNEFVFGLLQEGECLIDNVSVKNVTLGNVELIQNGGFDGGTAAAWRIVGNHAGTVIPEPGNAGNNVLKIAASGPTEHMHNHAETTLKEGGNYHTINAAQTYHISFQAKWLRGSNRLHSRLYLNRLAKQTLLSRPATGGTPGAPNAPLLGNIGPTFDALTHTPVVPTAGATATVSVRVADPDGVASVELLTSVNGAGFTSTPMSNGSGGAYSAIVPAQPASALVQFYIRATDGFGAVSYFPAAGAAARAMIPWSDGRAQLTLASGARPHNIRIVLPTADATEMYKLENLMSNQDVPCTVILDEREVYYQAGVQLKSSEHGRFNEARVGYNLSFGSDEPFLGTHTAISIDRSGGASTGQKEILIRTVSNVAGGIYATEDDLVRVISPVGLNPPGTYTGANATGAAILSKARFDADYLDNQWTDGGDGPVFKYELIYAMTQTIDPNTRVVDASIVPENRKIPQSSPGPNAGVTVTNLGADKEFYRWYWLIQNARGADDYSKIIDAVTAVGQTSGSAAFTTQTEQYINVNAWLRANVPATLFGVTDNYLGTAAVRHNALIYFPPGEKAVLIPWDMDTVSESNAQAGLTTGGDLTKFLAVPVNKRLYYGHMLDVLNRSFNTTFLTKWATHYSRFGSSLTGSLPYFTQRAAFASDVINGVNGQTAPIPYLAFARTSPSPVTVNGAFATITGDGWINIAEVRLEGSTVPLAITWTDDNSWSIKLPVNAGTNTYKLLAYSNTGALLGNITVTVNASGGLIPAGPGHLVISELNYNPPGSGDPTEFIELLNITGSALDLGGCHFDEENGQGIAYTFPAGTQVAAGGRIVVARSRTDFLAMYPAAAGGLAGGQYGPSALDNSGETIVLYSAGGVEIFRTIYNNSPGSTDGGGRSLIRVLASSNPNPATAVWRASTTDGGNPGGTDAVVFSANAAADGDGDGYPALLEYVMGTSDAVQGAAAWSVSRDAGGGLVVTFPHAVNADDAVLTIETTTDLAMQFTTATATLTGSTTVGNIVTETWSVPAPMSGGQIFVRLKAALR